MSKKWRKHNSHPHSDKHHVHPKSRGGKNSWNKRRVNYNLHHGFNNIFRHLTVYEAITIIKHCWTDDHSNLKYWLLKKDQIEEWFKIFGSLNTNKAVDKLLKELAHKPEYALEYNKWLIDRKESLKEFVQALENQYKNNSPA